MNFELREGISCCEAGGRFLFLDLDRNRYFALAPEAEQTFRRLVARDALAPEDRDRLDGLVESGLLARADWDARPKPCPAPPAPECSLLEEDLHAGAPALAHALYRLALGVLVFKLRPLPAILARLEDRKRAIEPWESDDAALLEVAAAFSRSGLIAAPLDQCLPRSIAVAHALLDRNIAPLFVIGVRLKPFGAHCWVQHGSTVVNETVDNVRNFTPILVV
jgi:hypothetical protein